MPLTFEHTDSRISVFRPGEANPLLTQTAEPNCRSFIHPIICPDGAGTFTEDQPPHHPWQRGLYVGINKINGTSFWLGETSEAPDNGTFHPQPLNPPTVEGDRAEWTVVSEWRTRAAKPLLIETQEWRLHVRPMQYELELCWTLSALDDLTFAQYSYGGLFLRMPWRSETGGHILTSEGVTTPEQAEAQRAHWVAVSMPLLGRENGNGVVAILDHPSNPEHPNPWRVDGELGVCPSRSIVGPWELGSGRSVRNRYLLRFTVGKIEAHAIETAFAAFSKT